MISNCPDLTDSLYKNTALMMIQEIGHRPKAMPLAVARSASPAGIP